MKPDPRYCIAFCRHTDMRVALQHRPAHVAHQSEHGGLRDAILGQSGSERVPEIMDTTGNAGIGPQLVPAPGNIGRVPRRVGWNGLAPWEQVVLWLWLPELLHEPRAM